MKITSAEFVKSAFKREHWTTDGLPEIAFLGRSNVGKSSLINSLLLKKGLARTSNTPGRTQSINFFRINDSFYFVDLPGYGYAKVSKSMRADWGEMARTYLEHRPQLTLCVQLIDARREPTGMDLQLNDWLIIHEKPRIVVATKADKISNNELFRSMRVLNKVTRCDALIAYSATTGRGRDELWKTIGKALEHYMP